jgi:hypothetical protein
MSTEQVNPLSAAAAQGDIEARLVDLEDWRQSLLPELRSPSQSSGVAAVLARIGTAPTNCAPHTSS